MKKRFTFLLFLLAFITLGNFNINGQTVAVQPPGDGSAATPWDVSTLAHLKWLEEASSDYRLDTIIFSADIDATETKDWDSGAGFNPLFASGATSSFNGVLDGQGHVIRNLYINRPGSEYVGLVARSRGDLPGVIMNLGVENCDITGGNRVGAIVGDLDWSVINCYSTGMISGTDYPGGIAGYMNSGGTIINCYSNADITVLGRRAGGLSSANGIDSIAFSYSSGQLSGSTDGVGGFIGRAANDGDPAKTKANYWDVERSGYENSSPELDLVFATGLSSDDMMKQASFVDWDFTSIWGIAEGKTSPFLKWQKTVVRNELPILLPTSASLDVGYVYNNTSGAETIVEYGYIYALGSLPYIMADGTVSQGSKVSEVTSAAIAGGSGADIAGAALPALNVGEVLYAVTYAIDNNGAVSYGNAVVVRAPLLTDGSGTPEDPFKISTLEQLNAMNVDPSLRDKNFLLVNDIDAAETKNWNGGEGWEAINAFTGTFDGGGNVILNLYINRPDVRRMGFMGDWDQGGIVKNLGLVDADVSGRDEVGIMAGRMEDGATAINCFTSGIVRSARNRVGGFAGRAQGGSTISGSYSTASAYAEDVQGAEDDRAGGFVGSIWGDNPLEILDCYATGAAYGANRTGGFVGRWQDDGEATNCYASGDAMGVNAVGAFIGQWAVDSAFVRGSYYDMDLSNLPGIGEDTEDYDDHIPSYGSFDITGLSTAEFKSTSSFTDWDFIDTWNIMEANSRPYQDWMKVLFVGEKLVVANQSVSASANLTNVSGTTLVEAGFVFRSADLSWSQFVPDAVLAVPVVIDGSAAISVTLNDGLMAGNYYSVQSYAKDANGITHYGDASFVFIEQEVYDATIVVTDETDALVAGASVTLLGYGTMESDVSGEVVFTDVVANKMTPLTIENAAYIKYISSLEISGTETTTFKLTNTSWDITFMVTDSAAVANPLQGVTVSVFGGPAIMTDASGAALFPGVAEANGIMYEAVLDGNVTLYGSIDLIADTTVDLVMDPRSAYVEVLDGDGVGVEGASVTLGSYGTVMTDAMGMAAYMPVSVNPDNLLDISADGFNPHSSIVGIGNETTKISIEMDPTMVRFIVVDADEMPMEFVEIVLGQDTLETGEWGSADFLRVPSGVDIAYSADKHGFAEETGIVNVSNANDTIPLSMARNLFDITFTVTDMTDVPLENAEVLVSGVDTIMTDAEGVALFADVPIGDHNYTVSSGLIYEEVTGVASVTDKDEAITIKLADLSYTVTFTITDDNANAISGALITLSGYGVMSTATDGVAAFTDVKPADNIIYNITKTGYGDSINVLNVVDADVNLTVALVSTSTNAGLNSAGIIEIYPNPASDYVSVKLQMNSGRIAVYDLTGKAIMTEDVISNIMKLDFTNQNPGVYMMNIWDEKGGLVGTHKILIQK